MKFNLNNYIKVQLTDLGREIHKDRHGAVFHTESMRNKYPYIPPKEDADGWSQWQAWDFMQTFGPHFRMGQHMPASPEIEIIENQG
ncbi:hypothetical protein [Profundibacter sp.]